MRKANTLQEPLEGGVSDDSSSSCDIARPSLSRRTHGDRGWPGPGGGDEMRYMATFRKNPPLRSPARGTATSTTKTACRARWLPTRPAHSRVWSVQRHTVEQIIDTFAPVPMLDALVPLVGQLVEVLKINDTLVPDVEQVIEVPKIALEDGIPQRAVHREPQLVEQLVHVSVPELVIPARGRDARGTEWCQVAGRTGVYWWTVRTNNTKWDRPEGFTASPGRYTNIGQG